MISIISGTNRKNSKTSIIAAWCYEKLTHEGIECKLIDLSDIDFNYFNDHLYNDRSQHTVITDLQQDILIPSRHWLVVSSKL